MSDAYQIETRRRSRSKTPLSLGITEITTKKPTVETIVEETVVVSSSSTPTKVTTQKRNATSDYSSEGSPESRATKLLSNSTSQLRTEEKSTSHLTTGSSSRTTSSTTVITKTMSSSRGEGATSTPKLSLSTNTRETARRREPGRLKEIKQNQLNADQERLQYQQKEQNLNSSNSFRRLITSSFFSSPKSKTQSSAEFSQSDDDETSRHIAYMEYKRSGEYWKNTPKTDYTYSELSPHRRLLAPGIVAMPNMSRKSLENHSERVNYMIQRDPAQEEYIRRRYENRYANERLLYESGDEADYAIKRNYYQQENNSWWFSRLITTIVTTVTSAWTTVVGADADQTLDLSLQRGFFGTITHGISSLIYRFFRAIYLIISSVLYLDTWLLQSSNTDNRGKKRFLIFLLLLLPLLLLGGLYYYLHPNESFPPKHFSEYTFTLYPELPKIDIYEYINEEQYDNLKNIAKNRLEDVRLWTDDYLTYLKTLSVNIAEAGRQFFQSDEDFDRPSDAILE